MFSLPHVTGLTPEARNTDRTAHLDRTLTDIEQHLRQMAEQVATLRSGIHDAALFGGAHGVNRDLSLARADYIGRDLAGALSDQRAVSESALVAATLASGYEPTI